MWLPASIGLSRYRGHREPSPAERAPPGSKEPPSKRHVPIDVRPTVCRNPSIDVSMPIVCQDLVMSNESGNWKNTTHDWAKEVDVEHLESIRRDPPFDSPKRALHLILEVLAYPADEASDQGGGIAKITLHPDGSISVADNGRGTDTRTDVHGRTIRKPVMATKDLRFFDSTDAPILPDGQMRRGMSVVAALSTWLVHTNRRTRGSWTQRYEHGIPRTGLSPLPDDGTTGTTVHFLADQSFTQGVQISASELETLSQTLAPVLSVEVQDFRS